MNNNNSSSTTTWEPLPKHAHSKSKCFSLPTQFALDNNCTIGARAMSQHVYMAQSFHGDHALSVACGIRGSMEDFALCNGNVDGAGQFGLYAVFDGHNGSDLSHFAHRTFSGLVAAGLFRQKSSVSNASAKDALQHAFEQLSRAWRQRHAECTAMANDDNKRDDNDENNSQKSISRFSADYWQYFDAPNPHNTNSDASTSFVNDPGSTATTVLVDWHKKRVTFAHVGDSTALLMRFDGTVAFHTQDHNGHNESERERVAAQGGFITRGRVPRLNGLLAVTRSLGDTEFETRGLSHDPDYCTLPFSTGQAILVASDGLWDKMSFEEVARFCMSMDGRRSPQRCVDLLRDTTLSRGSQDNVSIVLCYF